MMITILTKEFFLAYCELVLEFLDLSFMISVTTGITVAAAAIDDVVVDTVCVCGKELGFRVFPDWGYRNRFSHRLFPENYKWRTGA